MKTLRRILPPVMHARGTILRSSFSSIIEYLASLMGNLEIIRFLKGALVFYQLGAHFFATAVCSVGPYASHQVLSFFPPAPHAHTHPQPVLNSTLLSMWNLSVAKEEKKKKKKTTTTKRFSCEYCSRRSSQTANNKYRISYSWSHVTGQGCYFPLALAGIQGCTELVEYLQQSLTFSQLFVYYCRGWYTLYGWGQVGTSVLH